MEYLEEYLIRANNTRLIVGKILEMKMPDEVLLRDGSLDLNQAGTATISGLGSYHEPKKITDFDYSRPLGSIILPHGIYHAKYNFCKLLKIKHINIIGIIQASPANSSQKKIKKNLHGWVTFSALVH